RPARAASAAAAAAAAAYSTPQRSWETEDGEDPVAPPRGSSSSTATARAGVAGRAIGAALAAGTRPAACIGGGGTSASAALATLSQRFGADADLFGGGGSSGGGTTMARLVVARRAAVAVGGGNVGSGGGRLCETADLDAAGGGVGVRAPLARRVPGVGEGAHRRHEALARFHEPADFKLRDGEVAGNLTYERARQGPVVAGLFGCSCGGAHRQCVRCGL
ncbi:hypothetical protein HK405_002491, partial [Cladochytrium tenue]